MSAVANKLTAKKSYSQKAYLGRFPYNLVQSGNLEKYYNILTNFQFIAEKINHPEFGVDALINDYDFVDAPEVLTNPDYNPHKVRALKLIQAALKLSAHILSKDKTQLPGQLMGRLMSFEVPEIQAMLEVAKQWKATPWLRPLTPNLTAPGGRLIRTLTGHRDRVFAVAVTPDGKQVISASSDKTIKVWNLETGQEMCTLTGHSDSVNAVAVSPDGKQVISASSDKTLKVWNLETGEHKCTLTGHSDWVNAVAVTPDGKQVISGSKDNTLKVWNLETGEHKCTLTGHNFSVGAVAVTPDGKHVISGSGDSTLKVWNLETGQEKSTLIGSDWVNAVAVTPDGKQVISGSRDNTLKVWNLETGEVIASFTADNPLRCCAVAQDGGTIVAGDQFGRVHFLRLQGMEAKP